MRPPESWQPQDAHVEELQFHVMGVYDRDLCELEEGELHMNKKNTRNKNYDDRNKVLRMPRNL